MEGPLIPKGETNEWIEQAAEWVSHPLKAASFFYALYWLTEIKNEGAADFDFMQVKGGLYRAFRVYGVAAVISELANAHQHFRIEHYPWESPDLSNHEQVNFLRRRLPNDYDPDYAHGVLEYPARIDQTRSFDYVAMRKTLIGGEKYFDAISEPDKFLKHAEAVFEIGPQDARKPEYGWEHSYGKEAWAGVCRHLRRSDDITQTIFVDQSWSIQHNTGIWLNKVVVPTTHENTVAKIYHDLQGTDPEKTGRFGKKSVYHKALNHLLDQKKVANFIPVFAYANEWTDELSVNLRRLGSRHGVGPQEIKEYSAPTAIMLERHRWQSIQKALTELAEVTKNPQRHSEFVTVCDPVLPRKKREDWLFVIEPTLAHRVSEWPSGTQMALEESIEFGPDEANILPKLLEDAQCLMDVQTSPPTKPGMFSIARKDLLLELGESV